MMPKYTFNGWLSQETVNPPDIEPDPFATASPHFMTLHHVMMDQKSLKLLIERGYFTTDELKKIRNAQKLVWGAYVKQIIDQTKQEITKSFQAVHDDYKQHWFHSKLTAASESMEKLRKDSAAICATILEKKDFRHLIDPEMYAACKAGLDSESVLPTYNELTPIDKYYDYDIVTDSYIAAVNGHRRTVFTAFQYIQLIRTEKEINKLLASTKQRRETRENLTRGKIFNEFRELRGEPKNLRQRPAYDIIERWLTEELEFTSDELKRNFDLTLNFENFRRSYDYYKNIMISKGIWK